MRPSFDLFQVAPDSSLRVLFGTFQGNRSYCIHRVAPWVRDSLTTGPRWTRACPRLADISFCYRSKDLVMSGR